MNLDENKRLDELDQSRYLLPSHPVVIDSDDLRNGNQCIYATRFRTAEMAPLLPLFDKVGFGSMEVWGGATFDCAIRYCDDDPWERIRVFKQGLPHTRTRMLLRGQNILGYRQYPDDIVEKFVELAAKNGVDIFMIFDGLNDTRNCEVAIRAAKKAGKIVRCAILYTVSPVHTTEKIVQNAREYIALGADEINIADMAGQCTPAKAYEVIKAVKDATGVPVQFTACSTCGMSDMAVWEAIRAGADMVSTCFSSLSGGSSEPNLEAIVTALKGTPADPGFDLDLLREISRGLEEIGNAHADTRSSFRGVSPDVFKHQIPGGMLSNMESQLRSMNALDRIDEVFKECEIVRRDLGYPPLATPFSQMVGAQATTNVLTGKRYGMLSKENADYVAGMYGRAPGPVSRELEKMVLGDEPPQQARPGSLLEPGWEKAVEESREFARCEEDVMTYALFPNVAEPFLRRKYGLEEKA